MRLLRDSASPSARDSDLATDGGEAQLVGIDFGSAPFVRFAFSEGCCVSVRGTMTPNLHWVELGLRSLQGRRCPWYAALAVPSYASQDDRDRLLGALLAPLSFGRLDAAFLCTAPLALARAVGAEECIAITIDPIVSCLEVIGGEAPSPDEEDRVRPIAGREARELALAVRCLMKPQPRALVPTLLRSVVIGGDVEEIDRIGREEIRRELEAVGGRCTFAVEQFRIASGALALAEQVAPETWRRLRDRSVPRP